MTTKAEDAGFDAPVGSFDHLDDRARDVLDFPTPEGAVVRHQRMVGPRVIRLATIGINGVRTVPAVQVGLTFTSAPPPAILTEDDDEPAEASGSKPPSDPKAAALAAKQETERKEARDAERKVAIETFSKQAHYQLMSQVDLNNRAVEANLESYFPNKIHMKLAALTSQAAHASAATAMVGYETPFTCAELKAASDENVVGASVLKGITRNLSAGAELFYTFKRGGGSASVGLRHVRQLPDGGERSVTAYANVFGQLTASYACTVTPNLRVATRTEYSVLQEQLSFSSGVDVVTPIGVRMNARLDSARGLAAAVSLGLGPGFGVVLSCSALAPGQPKPALGLQLFVA